MSEPIKISFGFSKIKPKAALPVQSKPKNEENEIQYIDCLEANSIKLIGGNKDTKNEPLVIPMKTASAIRDKILEAVNKRAHKEASEVNGVKKYEPTVEPDAPPKPLTLDELAEKEILAEANKKSGDDDEVKEVKAVPLPGLNMASSVVSTLDDYEAMPINQFGLAMLRGMGWDPKKGIGLNEKIVEPAIPNVRPKGMGLGADKALLLKNQQQAVKAGEDELFMKKGAAVRVLVGMHKNLYGKVEGFDELPGRILVRLALSNNVISTSEFMVQLVTTSEFNKNSKVMNLDKFHAVKSSKNSHETPHLPVDRNPSVHDKPRRRNDSDSENDSRSKRHREAASRRKKRSRQRSSSIDRERRRRRRESTESSDDDSRRKTTCRKSKKHKHRKRSRS